MNEQVIVIGAGGHGKVIADIVRCCGNTVLGFLDDSSQPPISVCGIPVLGKIESYVNYPDASFVIAIGNGTVRQRVAERLAGVKWHTAIHPGAVVSSMDTVIGEGTVVMAGAVINPGAVIGKHCIINTGAGVDHDNSIGDYTHISVGATLAGTVTVGHTVWVGAGAVVSNNISICDDCMIGAGAVVVRNIEKTGTYVGVPARKIK
jgi:sugar O-acyltransferase (sialic acid O-acetyltransferase NeuD family)